jgi:hypothetical protein
MKTKEDTERGTLSIIKFKIGPPEIRLNGELFKSVLFLAPIFI